MNKFLKSTLIVPCVIIQLNGSIVGISTLNRVESTTTRAEKRDIRKEIFNIIENKGFDRSFIDKLKNRYSNILDNDILNRVISKYSDVGNKIIKNIAYDIMFQRDIDLNDRGYIFNTLQKVGKLDITYSEIEKFYV